MSKETTEAKVDLPARLGAVTVKGMLILRSIPWYCSEVFTVEHQECMRPGALRCCNASGSKTSEILRSSAELELSGISHVLA
jgi:hypothetical protein